MTHDCSAFYRQRIQGFETERRIFNDYIALIAPSKGELHVLDWEYRQGISSAAAAVSERDRIESELKRLRKEVSSTRDQVKQLNKASDARRQQIERLSELSQPVQKDATYLVTDRYLHRNDVAEAPLPGNNNNNNTLAPPPLSKILAKQIRTGDIVQLESKVEEQGRRVATLINDLSLALKEVNEGSARLDIAVTENLELRRHEAAALVKEVDRLDVQGYLSVAELLRLRLRIMSAQREEIEELERLQNDKVFFAAKEGQMRDQLVTDMSLMKRRLRAEAAASSKDFQSQHETLDTLITKLKKREATLSQGQKSATSKYDQLTHVVDQAKDRYERLRRRNSLEKEVWGVRGMETISLPPHPSSYLPDHAPPPTPSHVKPM